MDIELEERLYKKRIELASVEKRVLAHLIDDLVLALLLFVILSDAISNTTSASERLVLINSLVLEFMFVKFLYQAIFTTLYGGSIGKILLKIKVVGVEDFSEIGIFEAMNRSFVRLGSEAIFYLGFLWAIFDYNRQGWHDKSARTIVINAKK
jgi:uncharacterized RDD family membrane protein YckC